VRPITTASARKAAARCVWGVLRSVWSVRPGSTRSGENAALKSSPALSPDSSRIWHEMIARGAGERGRFEHDQLLGL